MMNVTSLAAEPLAVQSQNAPLAGKNWAHRNKTELITFYGFYRAAAQ